MWLALKLAGEGLPFGAVLVIESLLYAARTAAFAVPHAVGVQEGAYLLLGAGFGLTPEMSLALSLLKRQGATERAGTRTAERVPTRAPAATGASAKVAVRRIRE